MEDIEQDYHFYIGQKVKIVKPFTMGEHSSLVEVYQRRSHLKVKSIDGDNGLLELDTGRSPIVVDFDAVIDVKNVEIKVAKPEKKDDFD